jgi:gamma-glutamyltranspeptidase/glutathione hydrolase
MSKNGMVVCSQPLASLAGVRVLMRGGNAVDATVATAAVLGVLEPMSLGLGSDAFALLYHADSKEVRALDASGFSPYAGSLEFFKDKALTEMPRTGIHSVMVPGVLHGWATLLESYGTLPLSELLEPAIEYAANGFPVTPVASEEWKRSEPKLSASLEAAASYLVNGKAPGAGEIIRQPDLARTLHKIAREGPEIFYQGEIGEKIVRTSEKHGGLFTMKDLSDYRSEWVEPVSAAYRGNEVYQLPPATQGFVALEMLRILAACDLRSLGHNSSDYLHLLIEAKKLAFADRHRYLADRSYMEVAVKDLLADRRITALRARIEQDRAACEIQSMPMETDTEYLAVADRHGNLVSYIESLFVSFGSGVVVEDSGIVLQNRGNLFSLEPAHPNCIGPHKRCVHTLMPGMVFHGGKPFLALGLKGGHIQPQVQVQILANLIDFGMTVQEAIASPRFNHLSGLEVAFEPGISQGTLEGLAVKGHRIVSATPESFGGAHAILIDPSSGVLMGGSDPRKDGCAIGF